MNISTEKHDAFQVSRLNYGEQAFQVGDLFVPETGGLHPIVLLLHGGFWRAQYGFDQLIALSEHLASQGIAVWNIEYRRVGNANGGWPTTLLDVAQAVDYLPTIASSFALDLHRSVIVGHSAGGQLALWVAARHRLPATSQLAASQPPRFPFRAVISLAGAGDLEQTWQLQSGGGATAEFLGGSPTEYPERYALASPARLLPLGVPQILLHGTQDQRLPLEVSQAYAAKAAAAGDEVQLLEIAGADHFALINPHSAAWAVAEREMKKRLTI
ncbi:MAG: alpha/beta hydrolase [Ktedonobacteraceae bacterium]|nr:alpha/beta hydrolase [Ktedonobacteraceae bacterium]